LSRLRHPQLSPRFGRSSFLPLLRHLIKDWVWKRPVVQPILGRQRDLTFNTRIDRTFSHASTSINAVSQLQLPPAPPTLKQELPAKIQLLAKEKKSDAFALKTNWRLFSSCVRGICKQVLLQSAFIYKGPFGIYSLFGYEKKFVACPVCRTQNSEEDLKTVFVSGV